LISDLKKQMDDASEELNYEEAACLRDRIAALEHDSSKTKCGMGAEKRTGHSPPQDQDVVGIHSQEDNYQICILFVRLAGNF